jgi:hypothetical protein
MTGCYKPLLGRERDDGERDGGGGLAVDGKTASATSFRLVHGVVGGLAQGREVERGWGGDGDADGERDGHGVAMDRKRD